MNDGKNFRNLNVLSDGVELVDRALVAHLAITAALGAVADVLAAVTDTGVEVVVTTGITDPDVTRNVIATAGGTAADIGAIQVTVTGTDINDEVITEILPAFTVNTPGSVVGSKAFKTVTSVTIPAHDGLGATTSVGLGAKLGIPFLLSHNTVLKTYLDDVIEGTAPTITVSSTVVSSNTMTLNSALDGSVVDAYLLV